MNFTRLLNFSGIKNVFSVAAGNPGKVMLASDVNGVHVPQELLYDGKSIKTDTYNVFFVEGDSMAIENIHKQDLLFGKILKLEDKTQIKKDDLLIFQVDKVLFREHYPNSEEPIDFKLRKFCDYINLSLDDNMIIKNVGSVIPEVEQRKYQEAFLKKLTRARTNYSNESLILLSVTYLKSSIDFSLHPLKDLYAKVEYLVNYQNENEPYKFKEAIAVNSTQDIRIKNAIKFLAENRLDRYASGITEEFRTVVIMEMFNTSKSIVRGAFNAYSDVLNPELKKAINTFLDRDGRLDIIIYTKPIEAELLNGLSEYGKKSQIRVMVSEKNKFLRDEKDMTFCVGDESMYIIRPDMSRSLMECNFNDPDYSKKLIELFDANFDAKEY